MDLGYLGPFFVSILESSFISVWMTVLLGISREHRRTEYLTTVCATSFQGVCRLAGFAVGLGMQAGVMNDRQILSLWIAVSLLLLPLTVCAGYCCQRVAQKGLAAWVIGLCVLAAGCAASVCGSRVTASIKDWFLSVPNQASWF